MSSIFHILHQTWWTLKRSPLVLILTLGIVVLQFGAIRPLGDSLNWTILCFALAFLVCLMHLEKLMELNVDWDRAFWRTRPITWPQMLASGVCMGLVLSVPFCLLWILQLWDFPMHSSLPGCLKILGISVAISALMGAVASFGGRRVHLFWAAPACVLLGLVLTTSVLKLGFWCAVAFVALMTIVWSLRLSGRFRSTGGTLVLLVLVLLSGAGFLWLPEVMARSSWLDRNNRPKLKALAGETPLIHYQNDLKPFFSQLNLPFDTAWYAWPHGAAKPNNFAIRALIDTPTALSGFSESLVLRAAKPTIDKLTGEISVSIQVDCFHESLSAPNWDKGAVAIHLYLPRRKVAFPLGIAWANGFVQPLWRTEYLMEADAVQPLGEIVQAGPLETADLADAELIVFPNFQGRAK
jgi:hypothetical protein